MKMYACHLALSVAILAPMASNASVVVQWGADIGMTGGSYALNLNGNTTNPSQLDLTSPALGAPTTNGGSYYPNNTNDRSPVFFYTGVATVGEIDARLFNNTAPTTSEMRIGMRDLDDGIAGSAVQGSQIIMWTQDGYDYGTGPSHGFLNGGDTNSVTLTSMTATFTGTNSSVDFYWVIRLGSDFYATGGNALNEGTELTDPSAALWFEYDPLTDITDLSNQGSAVVLSSFDNLTAVGMLLDFDASSTGSTIYVLPEMTEFQATGVIPEPSTYAGIIGLVGLMYVIRRRKATKA
ncbi:PEP-CTERM sorting domain-containing protein [Cerasicoccus frondis]|uniref:PEP-CTERM sorting domain-containing protein n=1 Tax=Cerasicoccus frondis TaxID=490090 RepID=UPI0028526DB4|nr:PEP-CTERM sorting domain-containing protein [Cerasicoccus frondis]